MKASKIEVVIDTLPDSARPVYETKKGEKISMVSPSGHKIKNATDNKVLAPVYPVTPKLLHAIAIMLEDAKKDNMMSFVIVVQGMDMGAFAV